MNAPEAPEATGLYFEDFLTFSPEDVIAHPEGFILTEEANNSFACDTGNPQPLHISEAYAKTTRFGTRVANGIQTQGIIIGRTVEALTQGTLFANLQYDKVKTPHPVYIDDTLWAVTQVLKTEPSESKPNVGKVWLKHFGVNQDNIIVFECERTVMVERRPL